MITVIAAALWCAVSIPAAFLLAAVTARRDRQRPAAEPVSRPEAA